MALSALRQRRYPDLYYIPDQIEMEDIWQSNVCVYSKVILMGDSIIKYASNMNNTQIIAYKGIKIEQLAVRIRDNKIPHLDSKQLVAVHVGTNNVQVDNPDVMFIKTRFLIDSIRQKLPNATIVLSLILPRLVDFATSCDKVKEYNYKITNWANILRIKIIPSYRNFVLQGSPISDLYAIDHLHLKDTGTLVLEEYISRTLGRYKAQCGIKRTKRKPPPTIIMEKIKRQNRNF